jgi:hypothetical protein
MEEMQKCQILQQMKQNHLFVITIADANGRGCLESCFAGEKRWRWALSFLEGLMAMI